MKSPLKIRWAFDPFTENPETWTRAIEYFALLSQSTPIEVTPTYVLGSEVTDWIGYMVPNQGHRICESIGEVCQKKLKEIDPNGYLQTPEVLKSSAISRRTDANTLIESLEGYDLLVTHTYAKSGIKEFFLGSFAENILLNCKKPVVYLPAHIKEINKMDRVLFPTNLTNTSRAVFHHFLNAPYQTAKEMILYSKILHPSTAVLSNASVMFGGGVVSFEKYFSDMKEQKTQDIKGWKETTDAAGIDAKIIIGETLTSVSEEILHLSVENQCDFIALPSFSSRLDTVLAGSTTRDVIRKSSVPVLAWHVERDDSKVTLPKSI